MGACSLMLLAVLSNFPSITPMPHYTHFFFPFPFI